MNKEISVFPLQKFMNKELTGKYPKVFVLVSTNKSVYSFYKILMNMKLTGEYPEICVLTLDDVHVQRTPRS